MHASNARKQCTGAMPIRTDGRTYGESWLRTVEILTFRNARAHMRQFSSAGFRSGQRTELAARVKAAIPRRPVTHKHPTPPPTDVRAAREALDAKEAQK